MSAVRNLTRATWVGALCLVACAAPPVGQESAADTEQSVHRFECQTTEPMADGVRHTMTFSVVGLEQPGFDEDFVWPEDDSNEDCQGCPVTVKPADSPFAALNENGVVKREDGKLVVEGDADGFYWAYLVMYENSGYTRGYVRLEDGGGYVDEYYGTASCTVTKVSPGSDGSTELSEPYGFYVNDDFEFADGSPLMVALYPPETAGGEPAGFVDFAPYDEQAETTDLRTGTFRMTSDAGSYALEVEADDGEPLTASTWRIADGVLSIAGAQLNRRNQLRGSEYLKQCYALQVLEYELEESFTTYEYPSVDVRVNEAGQYEVELGCSSFDESEGEITVTQSAQGDFEATVKTEYATYVLRVPAGSPSRGQVLFGDSPDDLHVMANVGCYP